MMVLVVSAVLYRLHISLPDLLRSVLGERLPSHGLTYREDQIVELILHGLSNKAIAAGGHITEQTVKDHLKHVYRKMGVHPRTAVIARLSQF